MAESLASICEELHAFLRDQAGVYGFASTGISMLRNDFARTHANANPDDFHALFNGDPRKDNTVGFQYWRIGDLKDHLAENGMIKVALGRQWIVNIYAYWEHDFRNRIAAAQGLKVDEYKEPLFGDIRWIRNDILHNGSVTDTASRAEVLKWFSAGDSIDITNDHVAEFMGNLNLTFNPKEVAKKAATDN